VSSDQCKLELGLLGKRIQKTDVQLIEDLIKWVVLILEIFMNLTYNPLQ